MNENGWSFCIPTVRGSEQQLMDSIRSIISEFSPTDPFEILIIGQCDVESLSHFLPGEYQELIHILPFKEEQFSLNWTHFRRQVRKLNFIKAFYRSGWITRKKNLLAQTAKYPNLCVLHDYVCLTSGWKKGFEDFGFNWDVCVNKILNKDETRHRDWLILDYQHITHALLPYHVQHLSKSMYISGTYFCVKKTFFLQNPLNEKLIWGEGEDGEWSRRIRVKTSFKFNPFSEVIYSKLKPLNESPYTEDWVRREAQLLALFPKD